MRLLRRARAVLVSTTGTERILYTMTAGYVALAILEGVRHEDVAAVVGCGSAAFLALVCALMTREAATLARTTAGPLGGRGCTLVAFHGGPLDGGTSMVPHSHAPGAQVDAVVVPVEGGRYVAVDVESTVYRLEFEPEEATA
ncbi:hypothetical protein [Brachybacterium kimchii]|uniref:Uncharacterized protein n=1 Tax=Brachybacterium kimchii TaxID=2942909 RepID=A0ABY4N808_9MICO|nr:hypothetical protein [Brachybacterium kimchii]UQN30677.1 hypothetical protein M4486_05070 [Brachybacterium kimchii]